MAMLEIDVEHRLGAFHLRAAFASGGGVTALFGRSGAGKSTLINIIAGLVRPDRGRVAVNGEMLVDGERRLNLPAHKRRIGYIFQEGRLLPHLSVKQNLLFGHFFTAAHERYVEWPQVIELLDLKHLLARRPGKLSGGEKQRVAIGRALLASPRLLLMDEPLASLDSNRKSEILYYIERLRDDVQIPIVYVSHAMEEVTRLANTVVVMAEGKTIAVGSVEEVMGRLDLHPYTGRFDAGAVIKAQIVAHDARFDLTTLSFAGGELLAPGLDALIGERVRVRIRARDVSIALRRPEETSLLNVLPGIVLEIRHEEGAIAELRIAIGPTALVARITVRSLHELQLEKGQRIYAMIKAVSLDRHSVGFA